MAGTAQPDMGRSDGDREIQCVGDLLPNGCQAGEEVPGRKHEANRERTLAGGRICLLFLLLFFLSLFTLAIGGGLAPHPLNPPWISGGAAMAQPRTTCL